LLSDEAALLAKLRDLYDEYERLNRKIRLATQRRTMGKDPGDVDLAEREEQEWLSEINRLMDRMRATEGALMRIRGKIRPLTH
jgi:hypothetical protein